MPMWFRLIPSQCKMRRINPAQLHGTETDGCSFRTSFIPSVKVNFDHGPYNSPAKTALLLLLDINGIKM